MTEVPSAGASSALALPGPRERINLAHQSGGALGAFTWGVIDRFLKDGRLINDGPSARRSGRSMPWSARPRASTTLTSKTVASPVTS